MNVTEKLHEEGDQLSSKKKQAWEHVTLAVEPAETLENSRILDKWGRFINSQA